jgi:hypothetical protein
MESDLVVTLHIESEQTHIETGNVKANRVNTVTRMIVVEYGGSEGGRGSAKAKSRNSSDSLCTTE